MSENPDSAIEETAVRDELLSLEALLISRCYLFALFHKAFGGEPNSLFLESMASTITVDVVNEYAHADETMGKLEVFISGLSDKARDASFLDEAITEYALFFEGPADLPAYPWETPYISHDATVFQKSTLTIREAYRSYGLQVKLFQHVPDDHVSTMCAFMGHLADRSLTAFRDRRFGDLGVLLGDQYRFVRDHLNNWIPEYAKLARNAKTACLYPQLIHGMQAFARLDEVFLAETLVWLGGSSAEAAVACNMSYEAPSAFAAVENILARLNEIRLVGIEENELVEVA